MEEEILTLRRQLAEAEERSLNAEQQLSLQKSRTQQLIAAWKVRLEENTELMKHFRQQKDTEMKAITSSLLLFEGQLQREQKQISHILFSKDKCIRQQRDIIKQLKKENEALKNSLDLIQSNGNDSDVVMRSCDTNCSVDSRLRRVHGKTRSKSSIEFGLHDHDRIINGHDRTLALRAGRKKMFRSKSLVENRLPQVSEEHEDETCDIDNETKAKNENKKGVRPADTSQCVPNRTRRGSCNQKLVRQEFHIDESDEIIDSVDNISKNMGDDVKLGASRNEDWFAQSCSSDSTYQSSTNSTFTSPKSSVSDEFDHTESSDDMYDMNDTGNKIPQIQSVINQIENIDINDRKEYEERMPNEIWMHNVNLKRNPSLPLLYQEDMVKHNSHTTPKEVKRKRKVQNVRRSGSMPTLHMAGPSESLSLDNTWICPDNCIDAEENSSVLFSVV